MVQFLKIIAIGSVLYCNTLYAQDMVTVVDSDSRQPLAGAIVLSKQSGQKIITGKEGNFSLRLFTKEDTVIISYQGYEAQQWTYSSLQKEPLVQLQLLAQNMEEVTINTGYQKLKPNEVNGSFTVIDNATLSLQTGTNILDRLNGVTSSLLVNMGKNNSNPQNTTNITIRGHSTINGPLDPLIVLDNFIYEGDINNINPNDVESVTVLKDAAASAIWGARAGNGVIVITSKQGRFNQKLNIGFSINNIVQQKPDIFYQKQIAPADYIAFERFLFDKGYYDALLNATSHPAVSGVVQVLDDARKGLITNEEAAHRLNILGQNDNRNQYSNYYYQKGYTRQYALNLRGGTGNIAWLISGAYDKNESVLKALSDRLNLRMENTYRPLKGVNIKAGISYTSTASTDGLPSYTEVSKINGSLYNPYLALSTPEGTPVAVPTYYNYNWLDTLGGGLLLDWKYYPLIDYKHAAIRNMRREFLINLGLDIVLMKGLTATLNYQHQRQQSVVNRQYDTAAYRVRDLINSFSQLNRRTGVVTYIIPMGGLLDKTVKDLSSYNARAQINLDRDIVSHHHITAIAGMEMREIKQESNRVMYYGYYPDPLAYATSIDLKNYYPTIMGSSARIDGGYVLAETNNRFISLYANGSYSAYGKYFLSGSMRKDGANVFGATTNDRWKPLWSAGLGWEVSKEPFYQVPWLNRLRLSYTYGASGNVDLSKTALPIATVATNSLTGLTRAQVLNINNPNLRWEKVYQQNIRADFSFFQNRLTGSLEYYRKSGKDLYGLTTYDYTGWGYLTEITANVASMKGKGIDVALNCLNIDQRLKWRTGYMFSYNHMWTTGYFYQDVVGLALLTEGGGRITPLVGYPLYAIGAFTWGGLNNEGDPQGYLNHELSTNYNELVKQTSTVGFEGGSFKYLGSANPEYFGSLLNSFEFKGFEASLNFTYKAGYHLFKPALTYSGLAMYGTGGAEYSNRWQKPGDEVQTNVPALKYPFDNNKEAFYAVSEANVINGAHVRFQFINLSYSFSGWSSVKYLKMFKVYVNAANLGLVWRANKTGIDPDYINGIPNPTTITIGISGSF